MPSTALERLAVFASSAPFSLDAATGEIIRNALIDTMGCMLAGAGQPVAQQTRAAMASWGRGPCTVFGTSSRLPAPHAALANAVSAHALDFDDWEIPGNTHPSAVLFPALLAAAEASPRIVRGKEIQQAYAAGFEVICRLGEAVNNTHYDRGWHATATLGVFGAAAAVARLIELDHYKTAAAMSLAASQAVGYTCQFGSHAKALQAGFAAQAGVMCATLAANGLSGSLHVVDAPTGFISMMADGNLDRLEQGIIRLGRPLALNEGVLAIKPYPSCSYTHRLIDCARELREHPEFRAGAIASIRASLKGTHAAILPYGAPKNRMEAMFSAPYCVANALVRGQLTLEDLTTGSWSDPDVARLCALTRIETRTTEDIDFRSADIDPDHVTVSLAGGLELRSAVAFQLGTAKNPMSEAEIFTKFRMNSGLPDDQGALDVLQNWHTTRDIRALLEVVGEFIPVREEELS